MIRAARPLLLAQLAGNAILLAGAYYWLGVGESRAYLLVWSAAVALAIVCAACCLHGAAFVWFAEPKPRLRGAWAVAVRHLLPLLVGVALAGLVYWLAGIAADHMPSFKTASWLTLKFRKPVRPATIARAFAIPFWILRWVVLPVFLLPMIAGVAAVGWRGFAHVGAMARRPSYWLQSPLLLLCAFWLPFRIYDWTPRPGAFWLQMASFAVRLVVAYFLCVGSWLLLVRITSSGNPRLTQLKTVPSP